MPTRNVVVTAHQAEMIERLVEEGRYQNASEVLRDGLRLVERRDTVHQARLKALRDAAEMGWADIEAGRSRLLRSDAELDDYIDELTAEALADPVE
ncbi:MAG TPA: type II toxin-antitoxin system ParD family antitoxin [Stellaceae bacterium]